MKTVLITGVTGFFGSALAKRLLKKNVHVIGIGRNEEKLEALAAPGFVPVVASFEDFKDLPDRVETACLAALGEFPEIDVFYHFAWAGGFTAAIRDYTLQMKNAAWAGDALMAAKELAVKKFVYAGTYNEFEIRTFLATDGFEPRYTCVYATGKTAADLICRTLAFNLGIPYCTAFVPMPYGENNTSRQLANVVINCLNHKQAPKLVEGKNTYDLVYIEDIAGAFEAIGEKGVNGRGYYVGHRKLKTFREWIEAVRDVIAPEVELVFGEYKDAQNIDYSLIDLDALYRDTGYECTADFAESMRKTAAWVKTLGWE